jgi:hypothetical protein
LLGRYLKPGQHFYNVISGHTYTVGYQYNGGGQISQITYPSGTVMPFVYDSFGRFCSTGGTSGNSGNPCSNGHLYSISYNPAEQTTGFTLGNGVVQSVSYDPNHLEPLSIQAIKGSITLMSLSFGYSASAGQMGTGTTAGTPGELVSVSGSPNGQTETAS